MSNTEVVASSLDFPESYGDLRLISSNGVAFCTHRFLLSHCSPVFRQMLAGVDTSKERQDVSLTEDSNTLLALLRFMDPEKEVLPYDSTIAYNLVTAAGKYQVPRIIQWWEQQLEVRVDDPMMSLAISLRYQRRVAAKLSLRALIQAPEHEVEQISWIEDLSAPLAWSVFKVVRHLRRTRLHFIRTQLHTMYPVLSIDKISNRAYYLAKAHYNLLLKLFEALEAEPSWQCLDRSLSRKWPSSNSQTPEYITAKKEITDVEAELPDLPAEWTEGWV